LAISPNRQSSGECQPDREDGLRFFGFTQVSLNDCAAVLEVLKAEPISHLVALPIGCGGTPASLIRSGWARNENHRPSPEVTTAVAEAGGGTFWLVGKFDDPEYGTVFVSSAEIVAGVANLTA
ncbi:MAG: hypothetical protein KDB68_12255, partial [Planctomycetes bacterium]|nr:hypothetical protein [Planctomycetota bacterium]